VETGIIHFKNIYFSLKEAGLPFYWIVENDVSKLSFKKVMSE